MLQPKSALASLEGSLAQVRLDRRSLESHSASSSLQKSVSLQAELEEEQVNNLLLRSKVFELEQLLKQERAQHKAEEARLSGLLLKEQTKREVGHLIPTFA
jgi:hypothetical protein